MPSEATLSPYKGSPFHTASLPRARSRQPARVFEKRLKPRLGDAKNSNRLGVAQGRRIHNLFLRFGFDAKMDFEAEQDGASNQTSELSSVADVAWAWQIPSD